VKHPCSIHGVREEGKLIGRTRAIQTKQRGKNKRRNFSGPIESLPKERRRPTLIKGEGVLSYDITGKKKRAFWLTPNEALGGTRNGEL